MTVPTNSPLAPFLKFESVHRVYAKGRRRSHDELCRVIALEAVNLEFQQGEFVVISGASGGGKSTLLNLVGALDQPTSGRILFQGRPLQDFGLEAYRRHHVGFVFQNYHLLPGRTALDNVALGGMLAGASRTTARRDALDWLKRLGLENRAHHVPEMLSGGQCQRVALGRAMIKRPSLLLADEPTGNLDQDSRRDVLAVISSLHRECGTTVLLVTHSPDEAKAFCTRMITIDRRVLKDESRAPGHS